MDTGKERRDDLLEEANSLRKFAFAGISISTIATLVAVVLIPMLYTYLQHVQMQLEEELDFCVSRTRLLSSELSVNAQSIGKRVARSTGSRGDQVIEARPFYLKPAIYAGQFYGNAAKTQRQARQSYGSVSPATGPIDAGAKQVPASTSGSNYSSDLGNDAPAASKQESSGTCFCGVGLAGPPGEPGADGKDGKDGASGKDGQSGPDATATDIKVQEFCFDCPAGPPGLAGNAGPKGPNGNNGAPGSPGENGSAGIVGPPGAPGPSGDDGLPGPEGKIGTAGELSDGPSIPGVAGPPGPPGIQGPSGEKGKDGQPSIPGPQGEPGDSGPKGADGNPGSNGEDGASGQSGESGGCSHCPPPRTAPGY